MRRFWSVDDGDDRDALSVSQLEEMSIAENNRLIYGELRPLAPISYRFVTGQTPKDLVGTGYPGRFLLAERVFNALRCERCTGWSTYPVRLLGADGLEISGYQGLAITGRCGHPDNSRRQVIEVLPFGKFARVRGLYLDEKTWDGTDVFFLQGSYHICVTDAARRAIMALPPSNIRFTALDEITGIVKIEQVKRPE